MSREGCVHLPGIQDSHPGRLRTFWFRRVSLISPIQLNDPYDGSHYNHHADRYAVGTNRNERVQTSGRLSYKI